METMTFDPSSVKKIYMGVDRGCRCGCGGEYITSGHPMFQKRLKRFEKMICKYKPGPHDDNPHHKNISYGNNRALTIFYKV